MRLCKLNIEECVTQKSDKYSFWFFWFANQKNSTIIIIIFCMQINYVWWDLSWWANLLCLIKCFLCNLALIADECAKIKLMNFLHHLSKVVAPEGEKVPFLNAINKCNDKEKERHFPLILNPLYPPALRFPKHPPPFTFSLALKTQQNKG